MLATQSDSAIRHGLVEQLEDARRHSDELFAVVKPDSLYERPIAERHRIVFYIGHLEAFDWNLFHERVLGLKTFHPEFDRLFAFGIDPVGGGLPSDQPADWPSVADGPGLRQKNPRCAGRQTIRRASRFQPPDERRIFSHHSAQRGH